VGQATSQDSDSAAPHHSVFISYASADRKHVPPILRVLEQAGYSVWWDGLLEGGERFSRSIEIALDNARAVVVLWSRTSVASDWVQDEAVRGRDTGRLVPLSLDGCLPPLGFGQFQSIDLSHASLRLDSEPVQRMLRAVAALHDRAPEPVKLPPRAAPLVARRSLLMAGGVGLVAATGAAVAWNSGWFGDAATLRSIAVLPFDNLSGDPQQRYFSAGLTSEIRARLSRNALMQVVGQTSSEHARNAKGDAKAIARQLGVAYLLDGNVQQAGNVVKIAVDLTDGRTGLSKWADTFERPLVDIFAVQTEIATAVASALSVQIDDAAVQNGAKQLGGTASVAAFDAFLRGRDLYEAGTDEASDRQALADFDRAIALDSGYAAAYAARSRSLAVIGNLYAGHAERISDYDAAVLAAQKATMLAPQFAEGFSALGFALASGKLDMRGARAPFERSVALGAGSADILSRYATFRSNLRDYAGATRAIRQASILDPLNPRVFRSTGEINYAARRFEQAVAAFQKAIALHPPSGYHEGLGFAQLMLGQDEAALASFSQEKSNVRRLPGYAIVAHRKRDYAAARRALAELVAEYGDNSNYQYAQIYAQWRDPARALKALWQAWSLRDGGIMLAYADPLLDPIRAEPEFGALVKRVGFI